MALTSYQQAVLQEIGIPVWISKEAYDAKLKENASSAAPSSQRLSSQTGGANNQSNGFSQASSPQPASTPISKEEKQSRLAQLRANMGSSSKVNEKPKVDKPSTSAPASAPSSLPASPEGIVLSAEQKAKSQHWLKDLQLACVQLGIPSSWANTIMIGRVVSVSQAAIVLPAAPLKLTSTQKRELWSQLVSVGSRVNSEDITSSGQ